MRMTLICYHHNGVYQLFLKDDAVATRCDSDCVLTYRVDFELVEGEGSDITWKAYVLNNDKQANDAISFTNADR